MGDTQTDAVSRPPEEVSLIDFKDSPVLPTVVFPSRPPRYMSNGKYAEVHWKGKQNGLKMWRGQPSGLLSIS
jgi:hypothetical protein